LVWYYTFLNKYKAGISHEFLFHFNIRDYMDNNRELDRYLCDEFIKPRNFTIVAFYDIAKGLYFLEPAMEREFNKITANQAIDLSRAMPSKIFPFIDIALKSSKMALFIDHVDKIAPSGDVSYLSSDERSSIIWLSGWSVNARISSTGSTIFLFADNIAAVNKELLRGTYKIEPILVELPSETDRKTYIKHIIDAAGIKMKLSIDEFAKLSSGLTRKNIKDIRLKSEAEDVPVSFEFIKEKKHEVLKKEYGDVLEFIYPEVGFENVGGMENIKNYLIKNIVNPVKSGDLARVPMGVLLCGPSGTGKTLLVNALAKESGFNCVKIDMSRILGQYVGESEKNFKKCLLGAQSQQPVIVFVDEIDTAFQRGERGDSGVSRNIFSEFLQFIGDTSNRGKIIFIAATNRPDLLDPALKRPGRFDRKIPVLLPENKEREQIFKVIIKKCGFITDISNFCEFAESTENYTGAEIEQIVRKAYELAWECNASGNKPVITSEILREAIKRLKPSTKQIELMTKLAIEECDDMDLLPERYRNIKYY